MRPSLLLCTLPALLLTGAVSFAHAQAPNPPPGPVAVVRPGQPLGQPPEDRGPQLDFTFHNLPLALVIHEIQTEYQKASGKHLNVMIPENLRDVAATNRIDVELKQITVPEVLDLLGMASQRSEKNPNPRLNPQVITVGYTFRRVSSNEGTLTYLLVGQYPPPSFAEPEAPQLPPTPVEPAPPRTVFFFSLDPYLERFTVEDIITAVKTGWDLDGKKDRPTLKYHDQTKLLVASGDPFQVEMIKSVLANLGRSSSKPGTPSRPAPPAVPADPSVPPAPAKP
ncbi:MAG: hypothetical protein U1G08_15450 [Verrucomicrobiota bacterium]